MWISRKTYDRLKDDVYFWQQRNKEKIRQINYQEIRIRNLETELRNKQSIMNKMTLERELNSKIYNVKLILSNNMGVSYNVKATSHSNAREIALDMFCKNNKDFKESNIKSLETSTIGG